PVGDPRRAEPRDPRSDVGRPARRRDARRRHTRARHRRQDRDARRARRARRAGARDRGAAARRGIANGPGRRRPPSRGRAPARVRLHRGGDWHPWAYGFLMPLRYARELRQCSILRVFQVTGTLPAVIAKQRFGVPIVTTYGFWYGRLARSAATSALRRGVETLGLRAAAGVIVTTPELGAHVAARAGAAKVHLIPNGVDAVRFAPAPHAPPRPRHVLYCGS